MKYIIIIVSMLIGLSAFSQTKFDFSEKNEVLKVKATVKKIDETSYMLVPNENDGKRYAAVNLPEEFKVDGLKIKFSGLKGKAPKFIKMMGFPFYLYEIKALRGYKKKGVKQKKYVFGFPDDFSSDK